MEILTAPVSFETYQDIMHRCKPKETKHFKTTNGPFIPHRLITYGECRSMLSRGHKINPREREYISLRDSHFKGNFKNSLVNKNVF